jgi:hypothetical protein
LDLRAIVIGAATGALLVCLKMLFVALIKKPAEIILRHYQVIRILSEAWPIKSAVYSEEWEIVWTVESDNFPSENRDVVTVYKFLRYIAAEIYSTTTEGQQITYAFVGALYGDIISGQWLDNRTDRAGYYGQFQLVVSPTLGRAEGMWIGFSSNRAVKANKLSWRKL